MKIGIIADIHSNSQALKEVLKEFDKIDVNRIICCGDIIGIGPNPEETVQMLMKKKEKLISVMGNHEKYLIDGIPKEVHDNKRIMSLKEIQNHRWTHSTLSKESKKFIKELSVEENIEIENKRIYIVHYPSNEKGEYKGYIRKPDIIENQNMFDGISADIFLYGHTHSFCINNKENDWYINPGSLGCPMNSNIANAVILNINNERVDIQRLNIKYNVEKTIEEIKRIKFPMYSEILKIFYGNKI